MILSAIRSSPCPLLMTSRAGAVSLIRSASGADLLRAAAWPSGKAEDCKSFIPQFESGCRLIFYFWESGGMVDTTDLKSVGFCGREGSSPSSPILSNILDRRRLRIMAQ